ncbi:MAG: ribbon-helix-helix domain-containing protein [Actinomycetota bacterium]
MSKAIPERVRGRPTLQLEQSGPSPRISFRVPQDLYKAAERKAKQQKRTVSELARDALKSALSK